MYLIDVRDRESYEKGHLQGAVSVPLDGNISQRPDDRLLLPEGKQQSYGMQKAVRGRVPGRECSGGTDGLPGKSFSELKMPYDTVVVADFALVSH